MDRKRFFHGLRCPKYPDGNPYGMCVVLRKDEYGTYPAIGFLKNHRELYETKEGNEIVLHIPGTLKPEAIRIEDIVDMHVFSAKDLYRTFSNGYWKPSLNDSYRHCYPYDDIDFSESSWTFLDAVSEENRLRYVWEFLHFSLNTMNEALSCATFKPWFERERFRTETSVIARRIVTDPKWTVVVSPYPRMKGIHEEPWITANVLVQDLCLYGLSTALGDLLGTSLDYETYFGMSKKLDVAVRWQDVSWQALANKLGKIIELFVFQRNGGSPIGLSPSVRKVYRPDPSKGIDPERLLSTQKSLAWSRSPEGVADVKSIFSDILEKGRCL